jgi:integrase
MATFKICIFEHQKRTDNKYPVSIRVTWKRKCAYIKTEYYVTDKQIIKKSFTLKDIYIINELNRRIEKYEDIKSKKLGYRIDMYSAKELAQYFVNETKSGTDSTINFIEFSRKHIELLKQQDRTTSASNLNRTINALIDFCNGRERISINEITSKFLVQFDNYLRTTRIIKRKNQFGKLITVKHKPLSEVSIFEYMTDVRVLFNAAMLEYNDEDKDEIKIYHYPFRKYKIKPRPDNTKRTITDEQLYRLINCPVDSFQAHRAIFSRDVFLLSFYLVGMNLADLYEADHFPDVGNMVRVEYNRKKTKGRRQDKAFISIKVEPEAMPLFEKYRDKTGQRVFDFHTRYTTSHIFSSNVNKGLKVVAKWLFGNSDIPLSTYYARHTWATIARNKCDISKDDIDLCLNHVDLGRKVADMYIKKDWTRIDIANRKVINYVNSIVVKDF